MMVRSRTRLVAHAVAVIVATGALGLSLGAQTDVQTPVATTGVK